MTTTTATAEANRPTRVLIFTVDDAFLCVDLDRVDTVYPPDQARVQTLKTADGVSRSFLIHQNEPALIVDLREAFGLSEILGVTRRAAFIVTRAGSCPLAVPVDACIGVRDLDLRTRTPIPTVLQRDGGFSVGHLIELDGKMHTLLEPTRILSSTLRERLDPFLHEARAFCEREKDLVALIVRLRDQTTLGDLKTYARLARRNGRTRVAAAARTVMKAAQDATQHAADSTGVTHEFATDTLVRDLLAFSAAGQTGELQLRPHSADAASIFFAAGRIVDAQIAGVWGRPAIKQILAAHGGTYRFIASDVPLHPQRIQDAAPWLLIETLEQLSEARRGHHAR